MTVAFESTHSGTVGARALPGVVGASLPVPLVTGELVPYANLDHAASAPCLEQVRDAVDELLPWYASVHRGAGLASQVSTRVYERARETVARFAGARRGDEVIFTRNTTDGLNLLARAVPRGTSVVLFDTEHHAALLPWRGPVVRRLPAPGTPEEAVRALSGALADCPVGPRLVVISGASNVTGELWPIAELTAAARAHGARVVLDAAQLAPHRPLDIAGWDVDYVVFSGHKLYAPYGTGVLAGRSDWLHAAQPYLAGGGASRQVSRRGEEIGVSWNGGPARHEAGSPNVLGAHALATACEVLGRHWAEIREHERVLAARLRAGLAGIAGVRELSLFAPRGAGVGVVSLVVPGQDVGLLACALSAEHGIGVRDGAFCAHVAVRRLVGDAGGEGQHALRVSLGLGSTTEHVDRLVSGLRTLLTDGPRWTYGVVDGRWAPTPDPRPLPPFLP